MFFNPALNTPASISVSTYKHRFNLNSKNSRKTVNNKKLQRKFETFKNVRQFMKTILVKNYFPNKILHSLVPKTFQCVAPH